jgi:hypothetical protein
MQGKAVNTNIPAMGWGKKVSDLKFMFYLRLKFLLPRDMANYLLSQAEFNILMEHILILGDIALISHTYTTRTYKSSIELAYGNTNVGNQSAYIPRIS